MKATNKKTGRSGVIVDRKDNRIAIRYEDRNNIIWGLAENFEIETAAVVPAIVNGKEPLAVKTAVISPVICPICGQIKSNCYCDLVFGVNTTESYNNRTRDKPEIDQIPLSQ